MSVVVAGQEGPGVDAGAPGPAVADARGPVLADAAGLAVRVLARGRPALPGAHEVAVEVATEALSRTWPPGRGGDDHTGSRARRVIEVTALGCLHQLVGHPGRVAVPAGLAPGDVFDEDVRGSDELEEELWGDGVPLGELAAVLGQERRGPRLVGLLVLAAGLGVVDAAQRLGRTPEEVAGELVHLGRRWTDRRRLGLDRDLPIPPPLPEDADDAPGSGDATEGRSAGDAGAAGRGGPPLDLERALAGADARSLRRRRTRHRSLAAVAATAVVALAVPVGVLVLGGDREPLRVDAAAPSSTTAPPTLPSTSVAPLAPAPDTVPVPVPTAPPPTAPAATTTTAVTTTAPPPPSLPPNQPMQAALEVLTPEVEAGRTATVRLRWSDPDLADPDVRVVDVWGDPEVFFAFAPAGRPPCEAPGAGGSGTRDLAFRYATPGTYTMSVVVTSCDGLGGWGERQSLSAQVRVTPPLVGGVAGRTVVAVVEAPGFDAESATASLVPAAGPAVELEERSPPLPLRAPGGAEGSGATVLRVPAGAVGELRLTAAGTCRAGDVDLTAAAPAVPRVVLDRPC